MSGRRFRREYRVAALVDPVGDLQIVETPGAGDELPEPDRPCAAVSPGAEAALDQRDVDEILGQARVAEDRPHHRLVAAGPLQVDLEVLSAVRLEVVEPALDGVIDRDRYVEARRLGLDLFEVATAEHLTDLRFDLAQGHRVRGPVHPRRRQLEAVRETGLDRGRRRLFQLQRCRFRNG